MNFKQRIDFFHILEEDDLTFFAPPGEVYTAANSYNKALQLFLDGDEKQAQERLAQISEDYPLFPQASHLYGILLADEKRFEEAEQYFERVRLLDISDEERKQLEAEYKIVKREAAKRRKERAKINKREKMLAPVKKEIARESILQRASFTGETGANQDVVRKGHFVYEDAEEKRKTALTLILGLGAALLLLLFFFFFWRPGILKEQARREAEVEKLAWLEEQLTARAASSYDLALLLSEYQGWIEAGRPKENSIAGYSPSEESATEDISKNDIRDKGE